MAHLIRNFDECAVNDVRHDALQIAEAGYAAVDVGYAFEHKVQIEGDELTIGNVHHPLIGRRIFFVGIGKCAFAAAQAVEKIFGERLTAGIALDVRPKDKYRLEKIEAYTGTHPEPSDTNVAATKRIVELLDGCREGDLALMLISGGGSTLLCLPESPMGPSDERMLFDTLTAKGADIQELNTVRKHLSLARGGGLAKAAHPAEVVSLIISDVPGNGIEFISSGPTVRDDSTVADAQAVLAHYEVMPTADTVFIETPKDEKYFEHVENVLFLTNKDALDAMQAEAVGLGYDVRIVTDMMHGEAREVAHEIIETLHTAPARTVLLYGGESTVTVVGDHGIGGRNQELALAALSEISDSELILPFASDGRDDTDHAGAIADTLVRDHAQAAGISAEEYLARHDSYTFFAKTHDGIETGYLESNVSDVVVAIKT